ncbi:DotH/IcmK family type IV secretion protein [Tahibacter amnicola]|uniref:DotH/IcmK family type IV secretion protein n=1 Tax=Tahibacter amnicola TaxID=2976241 RepID=A0ABY6BI89_9GAMM|nr:DotH/IcmK family type IV secretion protein [Tahibacter amnicola]UXI68336.1 DotH/IcmK family type IV secretion protein [Tahibacter amnicola]
MKSLALILGCCVVLSASAQPSDTPVPLVPVAAAAGAAPAQAPAAAPPAAAVPAPPMPPPGGLGQQVAAPAEIVLPRPSPGEITEDTLNTIEELQLTPEQWEKLKRLNEQRQRERATPYVTPPNPVTRTLMVNLDPGVSPPVVRLSRGQLSSIVFSDTAGNPWYIDSVSLNLDKFRDARGGGGKEASEESQNTNILTLEPMTLASYGNVTVNLRGLSTPVIFILTTGQAEVDMRVDAKVPGSNPNAIDNVAISTMPQIDDALPGFLDGVPPQEARRLRVTGLSGTDAWAYRDSLYVRTKADAQFPAYLSAARSTSGLSVYRFAERHHAITFLTGGQAVTAFIEDHAP